MDHSVVTHVLLKEWCDVSPLFRPQFPLNVQSIVPFLSFVSFVASPLQQNIYSGRYIPPLFAAKNAKGLSGVVYGGTGGCIWWHDRKCRLGPPKKSPFWRNRKMALDVTHESAFRCAFCVSWQLERPTPGIGAQRYFLSLYKPNSTWPMKLRKKFGKCFSSAHLRTYSKVFVFYERKNSGAFCRT